MLLSSHKKIEALNYDEKENLTLLNTNSVVPLLSDVLASVAGKVGLIFKITNNNKYKKVII